MNNLAEYYAVIQKMLRTEGHPYSPEAGTNIQDLSVDYGKQLVLEAARLASREGLQQISTGHVDDARKRLRSIERRNWKKKLCGQVGGGFLGLGLSTLAPCFVNISQISIYTLIIGVVSLFIGTMLLMFDALT
jgi:hypothetical protein